MGAQGNDLEYRAGGQTGSGYLATPAAGGGPGVLVLHAWWGLTPFFKSFCDRLAAEGYVAFAPDLFDGKTAETVEDAGAQLRGIDQERVRALALGGLELLRAQPGLRGEQVGVVGFSFGAAWGIVLAAEAPAQVGAVTLFYGVYEADFTAATAAFQGHFAEQDDFEPLEGVRSLEEALRAAGREVTFHIYPGTGHWFFEESRPDAYHEPSAQLAWQRTLAFLNERLG